MCVFVYGQDQTVPDTNAGPWFLIYHFFSLHTVTKQCIIKHIKKFLTGEESVWRFNLFRCPSHSSNALTWLLCSGEMHKCNQVPGFYKCVCKVLPAYQVWSAFVITLPSSKHNIVFHFIKHSGVTGIGKLSFQQWHINLQTWWWFCSATCGIVMIKSNLEWQKWLVY